MEDYEKNKLLNDIFEIIFSDKLTKSGYQKQHIWELSYKDSLNEFIKNKYDLDCLRPKFVRKNVVKRLNGELIYPYSPTFETDFVKVLFQVIFKKYFSKVNNLFEFGCGSAHNLVYASQIIPNVNLHGLDWSKNSIKIINQLNISHNLSIKPSIFDSFKPNYKINIKSTDGILTVGTLEQLGKDYKNFLKFLLKKKPKICIHFETMNELYNNNSTLDYAAIQYMRKRNYLNGFLNDLKKLKEKKKIKIIKIRRIFGSQFHEGYSYVIWKPI